VPALFVSGIGDKKFDPAPRARKPKSMFAREMVSLSAGTAAFAGETFREPTSRPDLPARALRLARRNIHVAELDIPHPHLSVLSRPPNDELPNTDAHVPQPTVQQACLNVPVQQFIGGQTWCNVLVQEPPHSAPDRGRINDGGRPCGAVDCDQL
jgi:hypothetical protein